MVPFVAGLFAAVVLPRGVTVPHVPPAARRAAAPRAALVTFEATRTVSSEPFDANEATLKQWFGESDAVAALCSCAICGVGALLIERHCRRRRCFLGLREEMAAAAAELSTATSSTQADAGVAAPPAPPISAPAAPPTAEEGQCREDEPVDID